MSAALEIDNLQFGYRNDHTVIQIARIEVTVGTRVLLHGPSGCGKSTLLNLMAGTLQPWHGRIAVLGTEAAALPARQRDRWRGENLGFIFQQFNLLPFLSVLDNVLLPCRFAPARATRARAQAGSLNDAAMTLLEPLGLAGAGIWRRKAGELSVGQQQRVAAARALIGSPPVILADEPTSALDAASQLDFLDLLFEQCRRVGTTLVVVSHDLRLAERFDRCIDLPAHNQALAALPHEAAA